MLVAVDAVELLAITMGNHLRESCLSTASLSNQ